MVAAAALLCAASSASASGLTLVPIPGRTGAVPFKSPGGQGPTFVSAVPGDTHRFFVGTKDGYIYVVRDGVTQPTPFLDIHAQVSTTNEDGLFSLVFDPNFATNRRFYVDYSDNVNTTLPNLDNYHLDAFQVSASNPDVAVASSQTQILMVPTHRLHEHGLAPLRRPARVRPRRPPVADDRRRRRRSPNGEAPPTARSRRRSSPRSSRASTARCCASTRSRARRPTPTATVTRFRPPTRSSASAAHCRRSGPRACATHGASRSTPRPATSSSATSATTSRRRSTGSRRRSRPAPSRRSTAGRAPRACCRGSTRPTASPRRH